MTTPSPVSTGYDLDRHSEVQTDHTYGGQKKVDRRYVPLSSRVGGEMGLPERSGVERKSGPRLPSPVRQWWEVYWLSFVYPWKRSGTFCTIKRDGRINNSSFGLCHKIN